MKQGIALVLACSAALGVAGCQTVDSNMTTGSVAGAAVAAGTAAKKTTATAGKNGDKYSTIISHYASSYGVPVNLAQAVVRVESNYDPTRRGKAGEIGLMQIKLPTARMLGYSGSAKGLYNPETNIQYGLKYLAMAQSLGDGTTCQTLLRYNAGHAARRMNPVSARYCSEVKRHLKGE